LALNVSRNASFALQQPAPQYYQVQANYIPSSGFFPLARLTPSLEISSPKV